MRKFLFVAASWLLVVPSCLAEIRYTLAVEPPSDSIRVSIEIDEPGTKPELRIPAWCPGFYFLLDYHEKISDVSVKDEAGKPLEFGKEDTNTWVIENKDKSPKITFSYKVLGDDEGLGFFFVSVKPHVVFVNAPSALMYVQGRKEESAKLTIKAPTGWATATAMDRLPETSSVFVAKDYDELIDHPIEIGKFEKRTFLVENIPFEAVYVSPDGTTYRPDLDKESGILRQLSGPIIKMFEGAPFKRYVYLIHLAIGDFGGGLEHRASNVIAWFNAPTLGIESLAAHEFFHAWNVKQIRPKVLGPFDYTQPNRTGNLWFSEGVTDYYAHLMVYRAGLKSEDWLWSEVSKQISQMQSSENRKDLSVEECSKKAWEYGGLGVGDLSFYTKGFLIGMIFDSEIRSATAGRKSLDDVMRMLYKKHQLPKPGFEEDDLRVAINQIAGKDLSDLYERMVRSKEELPYDRLGQIGLRVVQTNKPSEELAWERFLACMGKAAVTAIEHLDHGGSSCAAHWLSRSRGMQEHGLWAFLGVSGWKVERDPSATATAQKLLSDYLKR